MSPRQVLSPVDVAFEQGYAAFENGVHRHANPYAKTQPDLRASWFAGWDRGAECGGTCND